MNANYSFNYQDNYSPAFQEKSQKDYTSDYHSPSNYPLDYSMDCQMDHSIIYPSIYITDCQTGKQTEYLVDIPMIYPSDYQFSSQEDYQSNYQEESFHDSYYGNYQEDCQNNVPMNMNNQSISMDDQINPMNDKIIPISEHINYEEAEHMDEQEKVPAKIDIFKLATPDESICFIHHKYIFLERSIFHLHQTGGYRSMFSKSKYAIKDSYGHLNYFCEFNKKGNKNFITNLQGQCLLLFDMINHSKSFKLNLSSENFSSKKEVSITLRPSFKATKFSVEYFNLIMEREELLDVHIKNLSNVIEVYYGKKKEGGMLITKAKSIDSNTHNYTVAISPNVDTLFLLFIIFVSLQIKHVRFKSIASN